MFDTSRFIPRADCGNWPDYLVWEAVFANLGFALAYFMIPLYFLYLWQQRRKSWGRATGWGLLGTAAFVLVCGIDHINAALAFKWPMYFFFTHWSLFAAFLSLTVAFIGLPITQYILQIPLPEDILKEREEARQVSVLREQLGTLESKVNELMAANKTLGTVIQTSPSIPQPIKEGAAAITNGGHGGNGENSTPGHCPC